MYAAWLDDPSLADSLLHSALQSVLRRVMAAFDPGSRIDRAPGRGEGVLPAPVAIGVRVLGCEGVWQVDAAEAVAKISLMQRTSSAQMRPKRLDERSWEHRDTVLL